MQYKCKSIVIVTMIIRYPVLDATIWQSLYREFYEHLSFNYQSRLMKQHLILQMRKLKLKFKKLEQSHTNYKRQSWNLNLKLPSSHTCLFQYHTASE